MTIRHSRNEVLSEHRGYGMLTSSRRRTIAATLGCYLACLWLLAGPIYALDPNKHLTQYVHTSWRARDGSAPIGAYAITQTTDGFLWFTAGDLMTFDGVRFASWDGPPNGGSISTSNSVFGQIVKVLGDQGGGLWVFGLRGIIHLKGRVVTSQFELGGFQNLQNISEDPDGSLWVVRGNNSISDAPLCHVTDRAMKCFGKAEGIPISPVNSILADGKGGFWLGGQTALVHWHDGVSETYPIEALKSNVGQTGIVEPGAWSRWVALGRNTRSRARARAGTIDQGCLPIFPDAQLRRQQTPCRKHDLRSRRQPLGRHQR